MKILIAAATEFEVEGLRLKAEDKSIVHSSWTIGTSNPAMDHQPSTIDFLITGAGMVSTAYILGKHFAHNSYNLAINLGICGSFDKNIPLGEVLEITEDTLAELGAEDDEDFITIDQLGFGESSFKSTYGLPAHFNLKKAAAITVNTVHGSEASIQKINSRINAQLESMEGAAFFYACRQAEVKCMQIRAVSNYAEKRNRDAWQIGLAVKNLNKFAAEFLVGGLQ